MVWERPEEGAADSAPPGIREGPRQTKVLGLDFGGRALQVEGAARVPRVRDRRCFFRAEAACAWLTTLGPRTGSRGNLSFLNAHFADEAAEALPRAGPRTQGHPALQREGRPRGMEMREA